MQRSPSVPRPYTTDKGGAGSFLVDFDYAQDVGKRYAVIGEAVEVARREAVRALGDASGSAGFPGLGLAIAAFGDVTNAKVGDAAGNISRLSGCIHQFVGTTQHLDLTQRGLVPWGS